MNFVDLCKRVRQDSGVSGEGPTSVVGQSGILARFVTWVQQANNEIQLAEDDWSFLWAEATSITVPQQSIYLPNDFGLANFKSVSTAMVGSDVLEIKDWAWFKQNVIAANQEGKTGTPETLVVRPDNRIILYPTPIIEQSIHIDYYRMPIDLVDGTDISVIPEAFHEAIIARALMFYADYEEDAYLHNKKMMDYKQWMARLRRHYLPNVEFGFSEL